MVERFAGPRGSGRTTALVNWVREQPRIRMLVVLNERVRSDVRRRFGDDFRVITAVNWAKHGSCTWHYAVDDLDVIDSVLPQVFVEMEMRGVDVRAYSVASSTYQNITPPLSVDEIVAGLREMELELRG